MKLLAFPAPNRYRKLFAEHPKSGEQYAAERTAALSLQKEEWPECAEAADGLQLDLGFEPVLVWLDVGPPEAKYI